MHVLTAVVVVLAVFISAAEIKARCGVNANAVTVDVGQKTSAGFYAFAFGRTAHTLSTAVDAVIAAAFGNGITITVARTVGIFAVI